MPNIFELYKNAYRYGLGRPLKPIPEDSSKPSSTSPTTTISSLSSADSVSTRYRQDTAPSFPAEGSPGTSSSTSSTPILLPNNEEDERSWLRDLERERDRRSLMRAAKKAHQLTQSNKNTVQPPFTLPKIANTNGHVVNGTNGLGLTVVTNGVVAVNGELRKLNTSGHSSTSDYSSLEETELNEINNGTVTSVTSMNYSSDLSLSEEYQSFRSSVALKKVAVDSNPGKTWKIYDSGPKGIHTPFICLAPVSGTADIFYKQILSLSSRGVRVIAAENPVYWSVNEWCEGFKRLLDHMDIDKVHLFGASLGGFLAQKFAEYTYQYSRVASVILCNSFTDTSIFNLNESALVFWMLPAVVLKKMVTGNLSSDRKDFAIAQAIDFMSERLDGLTQQDIASRLTINCVNSIVDSFKLRNVKVTLIDVFDDSALTRSTREDLYKHYPHAKTAHLKTGGNFPYLSRSDEVNMHILVHLRAFTNTRLSAIESDSKKSTATARGAARRTQSQPVQVVHNGTGPNTSLGVLEDEYDFGDEEAVDIAKGMRS